MDEIILPFIICLNSNMLNIVLTGGPGSGKGTQSNVLCEAYHLRHLSTGDLLRAEIAGGTELGQIAKSYIDKGNLVPDEMILDMLAQAVDEVLTDKASCGVIFDGYPRNAAQAAALDDLLAKRGQKVSVVFDIQVSDNLMETRLLRRAGIENRADDNPEVIARRISLYHELAKPVEDYYKMTGVYVAIDGEDGIEPTFAQEKAVLDKLK